MESIGNERARRRFLWQGSERSFYPGYVKVTTRRGWHHSRDDGDANALYYLAFTLHRAALWTTWRACERANKLHLRAFTAWRHLSISRFAVVCVSPLSREIV